MTDTYVYLPKISVPEGSSFTATAYFRSGSSSDTPSTAKYRVDCLTSGNVLQDWTTLTPATSVNITMTHAFNAIQNQGNAKEKKQLTVSADYGTSTETRDVQTWIVKNIRNF